LIDLGNLPPFNELEDFEPKLLLFYYVEKSLLPVPQGLSVSVVYSLVSSFS